MDWGWSNVEASLRRRLGEDYQSFFYMEYYRSYYGSVRMTNVFRSSPLGDIGGTT
jgi:hypothetical protein